MSKVVHFEIPAEDPQKKMDFFSKVFGWSFQSWEGADYYMTKSGPEGEMGIEGAIMKRNDPSQPLVNVINVTSIDETAPLIEANGGKVVVPKMAVGDMGFVAYFTDPEGMIHGVWEIVS